MCKVDREQGAFVYMFPLACVLICNEIHIDVLKQRTRVLCFVSTYEWLWCLFSFTLPPPPRFLFLSFPLTSSSTHCLLRCRYAFLFFSISRSTCRPLLCKLPVFFFLLLLRRFCFHSISCNKHNSVVPVCYFQTEILLLCDLSFFFLLAILLFSCKTTEVTVFTIYYYCYYCY